MTRHTTLGTKADHIGTYQAGTPQWHAARQHGLGGSEIASVIGLSPYKSAYTLWHEKAGQTIPDQIDPKLAKWGHLLEDVIATWWKTEQPGRYARRTGMWRNREHPFMLAEPDRLIYPHARGGKPTGILEIKTVHPSKAHEWGPTGGGNDAIPPYYLAQVQWYLGTLGLESAYLAMIIGSVDYREYSISADQDSIEYLRAEAARFMQTVKEGTPPPVDESSSTYVTLRSLHPQIEDTEVELPAHLANSLETAIIEERAARTKLQHAKNQVLDHMGTARTAVSNTRPIARRQAKGTGTPYLVLTN